MSKQSRVDSAARKFGAARDAAKATATETHDKTEQVATMAAPPTDQLSPVEQIRAAARYARAKAEMLVHTHHTDTVGMTPASLDAILRDIWAAEAKLISAMDRL